MFIVINLWDDAETAIMVFLVSLYKTWFFRRNNKVEDRDNDNNNAEGDEDCFAANICTSQRCNGQLLLTDALSLFSIDNGKDDNNDNEGTNEEA